MLIMIFQQRGRMRVTSGKHVDLDHPSEESKDERTGQQLELGF